MLAIQYIERAQIMHFEVRPYGQTPLLPVSTQEMIMGQINSPHDYKLNLKLIVESNQHQSVISL